MASKTRAWEEPWNLTKFGKFESVLNVTSTMKSFWASNGLKEFSNKQAIRITLMKQSFAFLTFRNAILIPLLWNFEYETFIFFKLSIFFHYCVEITQSFPFVSLAYRLWHYSCKQSAKPRVNLITQQTVQELQ